MQGFSSFINYYSIRCDDSCLNYLKTCLCRLYNKSYEEDQFRKKSAIFNEFIQGMIGRFPLWETLKHRTTDNKIKPSRASSIPCHYVQELDTDRNKYTKTNPNTLLKKRKPPAEARQHCLASVLVIHRPWARRTHTPLLPGPATSTPRKKKPSGDPDAEIACTGSSHSYKRSPQVQQTVEAHP